MLEMGQLDVNLLVNLKWLKWLYSTHTQKRTVSENTQRCDCSVLHFCLFCYPFSVLISINKKGRKL